MKQPYKGVSHVTGEVSDHVTTTDMTLLELLTCINILNENAHVYEITYYVPKERLL